MPRPATSARKGAASGACPQRCRPEAHVLDVRGLPAGAARGRTGPATPRFSVFTPSHRPRFLDECLATLQAQTCPDWEWIVLLNNGARWRPERPDERVRVEIADEIVGVGAAKRRACELARGEILVELDHDDLLAKECLAELAKAFDAHPEVVFVHSNTAHITEDGKRDDSRFNEAHGWQYEDVDVDGRKLLQAIT